MTVRHRSWKLPRPRDRNVWCWSYMCVALLTFSSLDAKWLCQKSDNFSWRGLAWGAAAVRPVTRAVRMRSNHQRVRAQTRSQSPLFGSPYSAGGESAVTFCWSRIRSTAVGELHPGERGEIVRRASPSAAEPTPPEEVRCILRAEGCHGAPPSVRPAAIRRSLYRRRAPANLEGRGRVSRYRSSVREPARRPAAAQERRD